MVLYLIRHPETIRNTENKLGGWERCKYSELGLVQFEKIVNYFSEDKKIIYSSDLPRAKMLAEKIASACGSELIIDKMLRERNFKETKPYDSYETLDDLELRASGFLNKISRDAIIVSHAATIKAILGILCDEEDIGNAESMGRDVIFKIETIKNENKLSAIQV